MKSIKACFGCAIALLALTQTQGCTVLAVGAVGATAASVANDRRTVGTQIDDENAENTVSFRLGKQTQLKEEANISVEVYNGVALLTGQAPTQALIEQAETVAHSVEYVTKVHNQIRLSQPVSSGASDLWIASKIQSRFIANDAIPALQINVIVENKEVFLMGRVTNQEATKAVDVARNISGVKRVVRAFEIIR